MSPYRNFINSAKTYCNSVPFLRFLISAHIAVFALGGLFYLMGIFLINIGALGGVAIYDALTCLGVVLMWAGLLLSIFAEDPMTIVIATGAVSVCALVAWIVLLARSYPFLFEPLFYFLAFGTVCILTAIKAEKFVKARAASAAKSAGYACPRCGGLVPMASAFCPTCGAPNSVAPQYAPPVAPQYAPPAAPQYAPPAAPQYAPPEAPQYAPPAAPQYAPPAAPQYAPPEAPAPAAAPVLCANCGAELIPGAVFCGKCGTKQ